MNVTISKLKASVGEIEYSKRNAALLSAGVALAYVAYQIFGPRNNIFDTMPKYRVCPKDELGASHKMDSIKRCSMPNEHLEIVYSKNGVASLKTKTLVEMFDNAVLKGKNQKVFAVEISKSGNLDPNADDMEWHFYTWNDFNDYVQKIAKALIAIGINPFDIVNLLGFCTPVYVMIQVAIMYCGALPAGIYTTSQPGSIKYISNLCKTKAVFVDTTDSLKKYVPIMTDIKTVDYIIVFRDPIIDESLINQFKSNNIQLLTLSQLFSQINNPTNNNNSNINLDSELSKRKSNQVATQCCNIVYTSGTTGFSKAVMLSHDNVFFECSTLRLSTAYDYGGGEVLFDGKQERAVAYLPLSHIVGQIGYIFYPIWGMSEIGINQLCFFARYNWKQTLKNTIMAANPTSFTGVPRIWEKFYEAMNASLANASPLRKGIFNLVMKNGGEMWENMQVGGSGEIPKLWPFISKYLCDKLIKKKIGFGYCTSFLSGGGVLSKEARNTFAALNMPIYDAFGMTECAGAICASRMNNLIGDSVGPSLEGCEFDIVHEEGRDPAGHGEICFRGRNCCMGYLFEPDKTAQLFDKKGWLHSGDIGYIQNNCVYVTGRIKELIVTSGGENIAPIPVENYIRKQCPALSQVVMCGDGRKYCSLLVTIACEIDDNYIPSNELQAHALKIDSECKTVEEAMRSEKWHEYIRKGIVLYNNDNDVCISNAARIQYFQILPKDLNIYDNTLSPTMKLRRKGIEELYGDYIERMYSTNKAPQIPVNKK